MKKPTMPPGVTAQDSTRVMQSPAPGSAQPRFDAAFGGPVVVLPAGFTNRQRFHGIFAEHLWCSRCTRAFPNGTYRQVGNVRHCPYADCSGHSIVDAKDWALVRAAHADYPSTPQLGTKYAFVPARDLSREMPVPA